MEIDRENKEKRGRRRRSKGAEKGKVEQQGGGGGGEGRQRGAPCSPRRCHSAEGSGLMCVCPRWLKLEVQPPGVSLVPHFGPPSPQKTSFLPAGETENLIYSSSECLTLVLRNIAGAHLWDRHLDPRSNQIVISLHRKTDFRCHLKSLLFSQAVMST